MTAKQKVKDQDEKFRIVFENNPQPMWVFDLRSQSFLGANAAAADLYGYTVGEFRRLHLADIEGPERAEQQQEEWHQTGGLAPSTDLMQHRKKNGRIIEVETAVHEIEYEGRKAGLAVLMDVTGRRQRDEQLLQAQKMEAVGMLAGGVAHDFNNLLTIITGYSQLVLNNLPTKDGNRHAIEQIMKASERAAALTRQLLAFSRRQVLQPKVLDLNQLVTSLTGMLRRLIGEDIDLRLALRPDLGRVSADPGQIEQVLMYLVVNARDAMPHGGTLTIQTSNVDLDDQFQERHLTLKPGQYVLLAVTDTGHGMDEATQSRLFEPFFTTKTAGKGTGLGLSTVFGIVKQSGGGLSVYSEPSRGTTMQVFLPRIDQPVMIEAEEAKKSLGRGVETILVVEDDEMVRTLVGETLSGMGYKLMDAADPVQAKRIAEQFPGEIQLLITDVVMPKLSGRELAQQLVQRRPNLKVLFMSGYTDTAVTNTEFAGREVAFLPKPFTPATLAQKVRDVLEAGSGRRHYAGE